jgi:hypothetical protein
MLQLTLATWCRGTNVTISTNFPGGNVLVQQNGENRVLVAPDLRGGESWFYWCFEATADQPGLVDFVFPSAVVGMQGPAVSQDLGTNWLWMGTDNVKQWGGGGSDGNWSTLANWNGAVPVDNADALAFGGSARRNNTNDLPADWRFKSVTFAPSAGSFVLNGNAIGATAGVMPFNNTGTNAATINLSVHAGAQASRWTTAPGNIIMNGALSSSATSSIYVESTLTKDGLGTLALGGACGFSATTPALKILGGTVVLDLDAGGSMTPSTLLQFGLKNSSGGDINQQGGTLAIRGKRAGVSSQTLGNLTFFSATSIARIRVDPNGGGGTALTLGNTWTRTGNCFLHIDLSQPGASLISTPATPKGGIVGPWCTVTDATKTGFATTNAGQVVRNAVLRPFVWLPTSTTDATNYVVTGSGTLSGVGRLSTLTIQGGGTFTCTSWAFALGVLMEAGVPDYTFAMPSYGSGYSYLHQYSTAGSLIFDCKLSGGFYKTGPGRVILKKSTVNTVTAMNIMEGPLQVQATLSGNPNVFNGGSLSGNGTVAGNVTVFPGGALDGTHTMANALTISGSLLLKERAQLAMVLANSAYNPLQVLGTVTNQGAELTLALAMPLRPHQEITLLTTTGGIAGAFTSVNGAALSPQDTFLLTAGSKTYQLKLFSDSTRLFVRVVPWPTALIVD